MSAGRWSGRGPPQWSADREDWGAKGRDPKPPPGNKRPEGSGHLPQGPHPSGHIVSIWLQAGQAWDGEGEGSIQISGKKKSKFSGNIWINILRQVESAPGCCTRRSAKLGHSGLSTALFILGQEAQSSRQALCEATPDRFSAHEAFSGLRDLQLPCLLWPSFLLTLLLWLL